MKIGLAAQNAGLDFRASVNPVRAASNAAVSRQNSSETRRRSELENELDTRLRKLSRSGQEAIAKETSDFAKRALVIPKPAYKNDGTLELPVFKTYGFDGKVRIMYRSKPEDNGDIINTAPVSNKTGSVSGKSGAMIKSETGCKTCASRTYKDGSDDSGVSFQSAAHISASASVAVVSGHEQEHVTREARDAEEKGQEVISSNVTIHMAQCPECKKMYAAGGVTEVSKAQKSPEKDPFAQAVGMNFDMAT